MDDGQLKNYTMMTKARSTATAAGYQGMLIITRLVSLFHLNTTCVSKKFNVNVLLNLLLQIYKTGNIQN